MRFIPSEAELQPLATIAFAGQMPSFNLEQ